MEELTIEEKAKRYDEAIEKAKEYYNKGRVPEFANYITSDIFPELKKKTDEEMIQKLIAVCHLYYGEGEDVERDECLEWLEKQGEQNPNPYTGTSFEYNNHTWGMCARDGGVDILCDSKLIKHIGEQKPDERKKFVLASFGTDIKLENDTIIIPEGCAATIDGNRIHIKREYKTAIESINEEKVDNTNKIEPKFKVGDWLQYRNAKPFYVEGITSQGYVNGISCLPFSWEDEIHLWSIADAQAGDVLVCPKYAGDIIPNIFIFKDIDRKDNDVYCYCSFLKTFTTEGYVASADQIDTDFCPATKEQYDILFKKMEDAGYIWDSEKKKLIKIE